MNFDPKTDACLPCQSDTTPCPVTTHGSGNSSAPGIDYPGSGLNGYDVNGYVGGVACGGDPVANPTDYRTYTQTMTFPNGVYTVGDHISLFSANVVPLFRKNMTNYPAIARLMFDTQELIDASGTQKITAWNFKQLPNAEMSIATDGQRYIRTEQVYRKQKLFVVRDEATPTNQILVANENGDPVDFNNPTCKQTYKLLQVNDVILINANGVSDLSPDCCSNAVQRTIVAIDTAVFNGKTYARITLEGNGIGGTLNLFTVKGRNVAPNTINAAFNNANKYVNGIYPGDEITRLYSVRKDCDYVTKEFGMYGTDVKQSYIQNLSYKLKFTKAELNKSYDTADGVMGYLRHRLLQYNVQGFLDIANTVLMGRNRGDLNAQNIGAETMGIIPAMWKAQFKNPALRLIRSAANLQTDDERVRLLLDVIFQVQQSGTFGNGGKVTLLMDQRALTTMTRLHKAFNNYAGFVVQQMQNVTKEFALPAIKTIGGEVEIMIADELQTVSKNTGMILAMNRDMITFRSRQNASYNLETGQIVSAGPGFKIVKVNQPGIHECEEFDVMMDFAVILGLVDEGAFAMIEGFGN